MTVNELIIKLLHIPNQNQEVTPELIGEVSGLNLGTYEEQNDILYMCDGEKCEGTCYDCRHTTDVRHAKNFKHIGHVYQEEGEADE